jgi:hypothetical protein
MEWLSKATLDIIGLAGFNYRFDAIATGEDASTPNELYIAFDTLFRPPLKIDLWLVLTTLFPALLAIVCVVLIKPSDATRNVDGLYHSPLNVSVNCSNLNGS